MNSRINKVSTKLRRGTEHLLFGKSVWVFRDQENGSVCICDDKSLHDECNFWVVLKSDLVPVQKPAKPIPNRHKKLEPEEQQFQIELDDFFKSLWDDKHHYKCMNCRADLFAINNNQKRSVSAHILPKTKEGGFPEIATDQDNILFLGCMPKGSNCNCHGTWDSTIARRVKMAIYPYALKKYIEKLRPQLTEPQQQKADEYMGITTKSLNLANDLKEAKV
jgi:hypothetical protein